MKLNRQGMLPMVSPEAVAEGKRLWQALQAEDSVYADSLGWLDCSTADEGTMDVLLDKAQEIRARADAFIVVGVGGSNQAARAVIDALEPDGVEIVWLGNTLSALTIDRELRRLEGKSVYMQVIAKNFETLEPGSHYRLLRAWMSQRYPAEELATRIILTGTQGSRLHVIAQENGHLFLPFPKRIGGRYSAFSPVGLLPLAAAGLDVRAYVEGGLEIQQALRSGANDDVFYFAAWRNECLLRGFDIEILCAFEPALERFGRWWRQLFGESEGKDGKGIFPACVICSEDLHSMGQYMQEGPRRMLETFLHVSEPGAAVPVPEDRAFGDGFDYLEGTDFARINFAAETATIAAHRAGGAPCSVIEIKRIDERAFGQLFYFFMAVCAVSGGLLRVNPFDQNGVEAYKQSMFRALGKTDHEV